MKFDGETDLKVYQDAAPHREYQVATAEQTAGSYNLLDLITIHYHPG